MEFKEGRRDQGMLGRHATIKNANSARNLGLLRGGCMQLLDDRGWVERENAVAPLM